MVSPEQTPADTEMMSSNPAPEDIAEIEVVDQVEQTWNNPEEAARVKENIQADVPRLAATNIRIAEADPKDIDVVEEYKRAAEEELFFNYLGAKLGVNARDLQEEIQEKPQDHKITDTKLLGNAYKFIELYQGPAPEPLAQPGEPIATEETARKLVDALSTEDGATYQDVKARYMARLQLHKEKMERMGVSDPEKEIRESVERMDAVLESHKPQIEQARAENAKNRLLQENELNRTVRAMTNTVKERFKQFSEQADAKGETFNHKEKLIELRREFKEAYLRGKLGVSDLADIDDPDFITKLEAAWAQEEEVQAKAQADNLALRKAMRSGEPLARILNEPSLAPKLKEKTAPQEAKPEPKPEPPAATPEPAKETEPAPQQATDTSYEDLLKRFPNA